MYNILGIDPGASGAISTFMSDMKEFSIDNIIAYKCPDSAEGMAEIVEKCLSGSTDI